MKRILTRNKNKINVIVAILFCVSILALTRNSKDNDQVIQYEVGGLTEVPKVIIEPLPVAQAKVQTSSNFLKVPILMYHHVGIVTNNKDALELDLTVSPADFEEQIKYFKKLGYSCVNIDRVYNALMGYSQLPPKPIVYSFDDGYKDVFQYAVPLLIKYDCIGSFAIATDLLGRPGYANWEDVETAQKNGMEILSHTRNHLDLTSKKYSDEDLKREIFGSKAQLEEKLNSQIDYFVYPYGKYNQHVIDLLNEAGYKLSLTTAFGMYASADKLFTIPRVRVHGQDGLFKLKKIFEPKRSVSSR